MNLVRPLVRDVVVIGGTARVGGSPHHSTIRLQLVVVPGQADQADHAITTAIGITLLRMALRGEVGIQIVVPVASEDTWIGTDILETGMRGS
jgi:hypothetical protein